MARQLRADGVEGITLTHYADETSFRAMKLSEEGDDFEYKQLVNTTFAGLIHDFAGDEPGDQTQYQPPDYRHFSISCAV